MSDEITPRAQAILDAIERESGERHDPRAPRAPDAPVRAIPAPGMPSGSVRRLGRRRAASQEEPGPAVAPDELGQLVDDVVSQTEQARTRLTALSDAIEDIAGRLGLLLEASVAQLRRDEPRASSEPAGADVVPLPVRERPRLVPAAASSARSPGRWAPTGFEPRVPVEDQARVLDDLLSRRAAAPLEPARSAPGQDEPSSVSSAAPAPRRSHDQGTGTPPRPPAPRGFTAAPASPSGPRPRRSHDTAAAAPPDGPRPTEPPPPAPRAPAPTPDPDASDSVRLVAVEMAVSGFSREEVGEQLRSMYGIAEPETTLDAVFGVGSAASARVPLS